MELMHEDILWLLNLPIGFTCIERLLIRCLIWSQVHGVLITNSWAKHMLSPFERPPQPLGWLWGHGLAHGSCLDPHTVHAYPHWPRCRSQVRPKQHYNLHIVWVKKRTTDHISGEKGAHVKLWSQQPFIYPSCLWDTSKLLVNIGHNGKLWMKCSLHVLKSTRKLLKCSLLSWATGYWWVYMSVWAQDTLQWPLFDSRLPNPSFED